MRSRLLAAVLALGLWGGGLLAPTTHASAAPRPNILLVLVDDLGLGDLGAYGGTAGVTPHLDAFAAQGLRFTRHYTDSTCTASRVALLSGQDPAALGFRPAGAGIPAEVETLPEVLRAAGYSTHHIGKWHAGFGSRQAWPTAQGFDTFFGFLNQFLLRGPHEGGQLHPGRPTYRNPWLQEGDEPPRQYQGHLSDILTQRVLGFLEAHRADAKPWFLNYWTYAPHHPLQPAARFAARQPDTPQGRYLALLAQLDAGLGQVLERLEQLGLSDNTLVLIASDNGGTGKEYPSNAPFQGGKATFFEGGVRTPLMLRWPGHVVPGAQEDAIVSLKDYLPTLAVIAGAQVPAGLPGRDLFGPGTAAHPLYWEASNSVVHSWAVLSADGRWRLVADFAGGLHLQDLAQGAGGQSVAISDQRDRVAQLAAGYRAWRRPLREVPLRFTPAGNQGAGELSGQDLQRAPGSEGWTFGLAVTPGEDSPGGRQWIAGQEPFWSLTREGSRWRLEVLGETLEAPAPPAGQCTEVLVGTAFSQSYSAPAYRKGIVELFFDGRQVAALRTREPQVPPDAFSAPTLLGSGPGRQEVFSGQLAAPHIWNERLVEDAAANTWLDNGVGAVTGRLCPRATRSTVAGEPS